MTEQYVNYAVNSLTAGISAIATTLPVLDGSLLPATGTFRLLIGSEIVRVTARTGNNVTAVRGTEGTTATTHPSGAAVTPIMTAAAWDQFKADALADAVAALGFTNSVDRATPGVLKIGPVTATSVELGKSGSNTTAMGTFIAAETSDFADNMKLRGDLQLYNPLNTFYYDITGSAIVANRTATLPLLAGDDTFAFEAFAQVLTNKTIAGANNTLAVRIANDVTGLGSGVATFLATPSSANLASALTDETGTGSAVFGTTPTFKTSLKLNNPADTFAYTFTPASIAAARNITLPLLAGDDTLVTAAFAQALTNKTIAAGSNTISGLTNSNLSGSAGITGANMAASSGSVSGSMSASDFTKLAGIQAQGASSAIPSLDIDWSLAGVYTKTLANGGQTFTFSNATDGESIIVILTGVGSSAVTWPTTKWAAGVAPTQTVAGTDVYTFVKAGSTLYGSVVQAMA